MFLFRNKKNIDTFWLKKTPYQELLICPKNAGWVANLYSLITRILRHLIWVYTVYSGLSVPIFRVIMVEDVGIQFIAPDLDITHFFQPKIIYVFFLFLHGSICCGYSLEAPCLDAFNEYPQHILSWRNKKN